MVLHYENGLKYSIFWNMKSHLYSTANIWLPSNATLIQIYLLIFIQVKKRVTVAVVRVQQNEHLFIALILSSSFVDSKQLLIYCR